VTGKVEKSDSSLSKRVYERFDTGCIWARISNVGLEPEQMANQTSFCFDLR